MDLEVPEGSNERENLAKLVSRANALRLKHEYREAEATCLRVLDIDPDEFSALALLGDIFRDQSQLEQAREWYGLALEVDPQHAETLAKQDRVERELSLSDHKTAADQLGLPTPRNSRKWFASGVAAFLILVAVVAFAAFRSNQNRTHTLYETPIDIGKVIPEPSPTQPEPAPTSEENRHGMTNLEEDLFKKLQANQDFGKSITGVALKAPHSAVVTATVDGAGDQAAMQIGKMTLAADPTLTSVTVCILKDTRVLTVITTQVQAAVPATNPKPETPTDKPFPETKETNSSEQPSDSN